MSDTPKRTATGIGAGIGRWLRDNWQEETNLGKAKLAALVVLVVLFALTLRPDVPDEEVADTSLAEAERQAAETYKQYESRIAELERESPAPAAEGEDKAAAQEAAEAYQGYEARVTELEHEQRELLDSAGQQAAAAYRDYEHRIRELEQEKQQLQQAMAEAGADELASQQAAEAYQGYESRILELEAEQRSLRQKLAAAGSLETAEQATARYEGRIAELEQENSRLAQRVQALEQALEQAGSPAAASTDQQQAADLHAELQRLRAGLQQLLDSMPAQP